jgi:integrase
MTKRIKTDYPGVFYRIASVGKTGQTEKVFYIRYRKDGKLVEEKAGHQYKNNMSPAKAAGIRAERMQGKKPTNREIREAILAAEKAKKDRWTIDRLWGEYKAQKVENRSLKTDINRYEKYLKGPFGHKMPNEIIQLEVDRLRLNLLKSLKPQTVHHVLSLLKRVISFGTRKGLCVGISFQIEMPKVNNLKTEDLSDTQLQALLRAIDASNHSQAPNLMKLALFTGMRRGEMFRLKWSDIDFERGFIHIRDPKGGPDQKIPLNEASRQLFKSHKRTRSPYVFPGRDGKQRTDIKKPVREIKKAAGLPKDFRPLHGLRHVYASMLASSGRVDMYTLQKLLTHKSPQMTQRYAHLRDEALRRAADLVGALIDKAMNRQDEVADIED